MELSEKAEGSLQAVSRKMGRLGEFTSQQRVPTADTPLEEGFNYLATMRTILGNFSSDLRLVACLMAQDYLMRVLPMRPFDITEKSQNAAGLDIDELTLDGERVIEEIKTTVPNYGVRLGAEQLRNFKKDFAKLAEMQTTHKFLFVTDAATSALMTQAYASQLVEVRGVNLTTEETYEPL
jgi:hypothetical protein